MNDAEWSAAAGGTPDQWKRMTSLGDIPPQAPQPGEVAFVEATFEDGTVARWAISDFPFLDEALEGLLGPPDTIKP